MKGNTCSTETCENRVCGRDECGNICGSCEVGFSCSNTGHCFQPILHSASTCEEAITVSPVPGEIITINGTTTTDLQNSVTLCSISGYNGIWYELTHSFVSQITISTLGSLFDTILLALTGPCSGLACIASNDDFFQDGTSLITICASANQNYFIFVGGFYGDEVGNFMLTITTSVQSTCASRGAACEGAYDVCMLPDDVHTFFGQTSVFQQNSVLGCEYESFNGVWYHFNNNFSSQMSISTIGSTFDTSLVVFVALSDEDPCLALECFVSNDDFDQFTSQVDFCGAESVDFYVFIGGFDQDVVGDYVLSFTASQVETCEPLGSTCYNPLVVTLFNNDYYQLTGVTSSFGNYVGGCEFVSFDGFWFLFTNSFSSEMTITTVGSHFDTALVVLSGPNCNLLSCVTSNDNATSATTASQVDFCAEVNVNYFIFVGGSGEGVFGNFMLGFTTTAVTSCVPQGYGCADPFIISIDPDTETTTSGSTSLDIGNYLITCESEAYNGIWFQFSNEFHSQMRISTSGSDFDTSLIVLGGSCSLLGCVGSNDDADQSTVTSQLELCAFAEMNYFVFIGGTDSLTVGKFILTFSTHSQEQPCTVSGLSCEESIEIAVLQDKTTAVTGSTSSLLGNSLTDCIFESFNGLWYHFVNEYSSLLTASTYGSFFDTTLVAMSGPSCDQMVCVTSNDDFGDLTSQINFCAQENIDYFIFVGGYNNLQVGSFTLTFTAQSTTSCISTGFICEEAYELSIVENDTTMVSGTTSTTIGNSAQNCVYPAFDGSWYKFTNTFASEMSVSTAGSDFDTALVVISGPSCAEFFCVGSSDNFHGETSQIDFCAEANVNYYVFVGAHADDIIGNYVLSFTTQVRESCAIPGVTCEDAHELSVQGDLSFEGITLFIHTQFQSCTHTVYNGIWYKLTNFFAGEVTISTTGSEFDTVLNALRGSCLHLECIANNDDIDETHQDSRVSFCAAAFVEYFVIVGGYSPSEAGNYMLNFVTSRNSPNCCEANCSGKECGSDGCSGSCGTCDSDSFCANFICFANPSQASAPASDLASSQSPPPASPSQSVESSSSPTATTTPTAPASTSLPAPSASVSQLLSNSATNSGATPAPTTIGSISVAPFPSLTTSSPASSSIIAEQSSTPSSAPIPSQTLVPESPTSAQSVSSLSTSTPSPATSTNSFEIRIVLVKNSTNEQADSQKISNLLNPKLNDGATATVKLISEQEVIVLICDTSESDMNVLLDAFSNDEFGGTVLEGANVDGIQSHANCNTL